MQRHAGGRPPKFSEPSRVVTVTLPDRTLEKLHRLDPDRAKAIVGAVDAATGGRADAPQAVEVADVEVGIGLIIVPELPCLARIPWLRMVRIAPGRHLLAITSGTPVEKVELALMDVLEECRRSSPAEVPWVERIRELLSKSRRKGRTSKAEILFVEVDRKGKRSAER